MTVIILFQRLIFLALLTIVFGQATYANQPNYPPPDPGYHQPPTYPAYSPPYTLSPPYKPPYTPSYSHSQSYPTDSYHKTYPTETYYKSYSTETYHKSYPTDSYAPNYAKDPSTHSDPYHAYSEPYHTYSDPYHTPYTSPSYTPTPYKYTPYPGSYPVPSGYAIYPSNWTCTPPPEPPAGEYHPTPPTQYPPPSYGQCPKPCNVHYNTCDATTAPTCIYPDPYVAYPRAACACRPGYKAGGYADSDAGRHWRLPVRGQEYRVWVAEGVKCDKLCTISWGVDSCKEVTLLGRDCVG
jgi:hypothetical protein